MAIKFSDITGGGVPFGNNASRPANPGVGKLYSNGEAARLELYTATGWQNIVQEVPGVASIIGTYSEQTNSGTITIAGTNFVSGAIASAIGTNGVEVIASSTTYNSLVQLTATFTGLLNANEPYDIKVTNPSNLFGLIPDALYINANPVWQTASGSLGSFGEQVSISVSATATDSDSTISYVLASGSALPSGLTLNSATGVISGTLPDITTNTTYTFTINASDGVNTIPRSFSITSTALVIEYLLVGGGGAGGWDVGGGGGAGGMLTGTYALSNTKSFPISIGTGGASITSNSQRNNGGNTEAFSLTAFGGGGGGNWNAGGPYSNGLSGGSGGGGGGWSQIGYGGAGTSGQGYAGGNATSNASPSTGGGGGGAGGAGANGVNGDNTGQPAGGLGVASSITGTSVVYAAGGRGGGDNTPDSSTFNGTDGLGNGGDGEGLSAKRRGGSGVVVIAYPNTYPALSSIPGTLTYDQPSRSGYRVYRFTAGSGTITF